MTSQDLHTATKIYGQLVPELRGKAVKQRGNDTLSTEPSGPISKIATVMHTDIMFVNRSFLLTIVSDLHGSRSTPHLRSTLDHHLLHRGVTTNSTLTKFESLLLLEGSRVQFVVLDNMFQ